MLVRSNAITVVSRRQDTTKGWHSDWSHLPPVNLEAFAQDRSLQVLEEKRMIGNPYRNDSLDSRWKYISVINELSSQIPKCDMWNTNTLEKLLAVDLADAVRATTRAVESSSDYL
ncbi:hypothetical protein M0802_000485 [Mischocyttarus mexicanus]|nr:hypothetical protein M0802_000485 [Mischocyttarus mexicanus]